MTEEQVFLAALDLANPAERSAYLDRACAGDAELRRHVQELLAAHFRTGEFLDEPAARQIAAGRAAPNLDNTASVDLDTGEAAVADDRNAADPSDALPFLEPPTRPDSLGRIGHYEVLAVLGRGGFGIVLRAFDEVLQRVVALKVLAPTIAATSPARKRFIREARSSAAVRHENVVQVYAVEEKPLPYLAMEFIPGETLQQRLERSGPLEAPEIVRISRQIAEGLAAAHANGLIHRDIKPGNILLETGTVERVKITDFGLARAADDASLTQSGTLSGTPMFMAPEQAKGETLDHRADLFSLGSVMYVMATGRPPFRASTTFAVLKRVVEEEPRPIRDVIPEVPPWLCLLIARLQAKNPDDRFATAREVADLLGRCQAELQLPGHVPTIPERAPAKVFYRPQPQPAAPASRPPFRAGLWVAVALPLLLLGGLAVTEATGVTNILSTVGRPAAPEATLVVEVDDPAITVTIDGADLPMNGAKVREIRLKPGTYTVEARKDGEVVRRELVAIGKDGREVVRITQAAPPPPPGPKKTPEPEPKEKGPSVAWAVLKPVEMNSQGGATLALQDDRSVLVSGTHPDHDVYTLTFRELPGRIHAIRLEVLPHDSLPQKGPGRDPGLPFVLTTIRAELIQPKGPPSALKLTRAWADFEPDDSLAEYAIDAKDITGWATEAGQAHYAVFEPEEPVAVPEGAALRVTLEFKHDVPRRQLGCFRLSAAREKVGRPPP